MHTMANAHILEITDRSKNLFRAFLVVSLVIHAIVLFNKRSENLFSGHVAKTAPTTSTIQLKLREELEPQPTPQVQKIEKRKKKVLKKVARTKKEKVVETPKEVVASSAPAAPKVKAFQSSIKNYTHPIYPRLALRRGITGKVVLSLIIKGNGLIQDVLLVESSGSEMLDKSALTAAKSWTFKAIGKGENELFKVTKNIVFTL